VIRIANDSLLRAPGPRATLDPPPLKGRGGGRVKARRDMGIYFLALVVVLTFVYLGFALFRPEKF